MCIRDSYLVNTRVAVSQAVLESYPKLLGSNINCIYNGIPVANLPAKLTIEQKLITRKQYDVDKDDFLVVVPARYVEVKGHAVLCAALALLKDIYLSLIHILFCLKQQTVVRLQLDQVLVLGKTFK